MPSSLLSSQYDVVWTKHIFEMFSDTKFVFSFFGIFRVKKKSFLSFFVHVVYLIGQIDVDWSRYAKKFLNSIARHTKTQGELLSPWCPHRLY